MKLEQYLSIFAGGTVRAGSAALTAALSLAAGMMVPSTSFAVGQAAIKAVCGKGDRTETGLQGQTSLADRFAPGTVRSYNCNLQLIGQVRGDGSGRGLATTEKCAYFNQVQPTELVPVLKTPGVVVVNVEDSANPKIAKYLRTPAMLNANESMILNQARKLLIAQNVDQTRTVGMTTDIYDVSDCLNPVLKFSGIIPGYIHHSGDFSPDGTIFWASPSEDRADVITALDLADPANPRILTQWKSNDPKLTRFHGVSTSNDGRYLYFTIGRHFSQEKLSEPSQGLGILDVSEVHARKPGATIKMVGKPLIWSDVEHNQYVRPVTIKGRKYVWENNMEGAMPVHDVVPTGRVFVGVLASREHIGERISNEEGCRRNPHKPGWGYVSLIDVEDPAHPARVSALRLEVHEPKNCLAIANDPSFGFTYSPWNCSVDNPDDAKMMACGFGVAGVRVFDIRDVKRPREIGYYKPPGTGSAPNFASTFSIRDSAGGTEPTKFHSADEAIYPHFAKGGREIWFISFDNAFQVLKFSDEFVAKEPDLFR